MQMWSTLFLVCGAVGVVWGHGRVLDPPGRGSAWRAGFDVAANYDDDGLNCGGFYHQWTTNSGKCGICGDPYDMSLPRSHELGGTYGSGTIVANYEAGETINATVEITAYHRGYWEFKICPDPESSDQECFDQYPLELEEGGTQYYPQHGSGQYFVSYRLPDGLFCEHCVLQWQYTAGNNWGDCNNGTQGLGCGNQEWFRACSDITISVPAVYAPQYDIPSPLLYYLKNGYFDVRQGLLHMLRQSVSLNTVNAGRYKDKYRKIRQGKKKKLRKKDKKNSHWR